MVLEKKYCHKCGSDQIVKNGCNGSGNPKYKCKACGFSGAFQPKVHSEEFKETVIRAAQERSSSRGLSRTFGISHQTALNWIKKKAEILPDIVETLLPWRQGDVLELDELWSFVYCKRFKRWIWIALCRRTRQVVSYFVGDRGIDSCQAFWDWVPKDYRKSFTFSDFWEAYSAVIDNGKHQSVGKETGETCHVERWNCTLRQRICRFVRKTLSFSKSDEMHQLYLKLFIYNYNLSLVN